MREKIISIFFCQILLFLRRKNMQRGSKTSYKRESDFQSDLIDELEQMFPGCIVTKIVPISFQGIPDLLVLYKDRWATLECKIAEDAEHQPNQDFYVDIMNHMSFSSFIHPDNKEEVLNELQKTFKSGR